jgi:hypothetical protein
MKMKFKSRFRLELENTGLPHKALAFGAGIDQGQLSRMLADHHDEDLPAWRLPSVTRELGPELMEWLALQCGGTYSHGLVSAGPRLTVAVLLGQLAHQSGDCLQSLIQDMADAHWSQAEREVSIPGLRALREVVAALLRAAERGEGEA